MYGIELPNAKLKGEKAFAFIQNHKKELSDEDELPATHEEAIEFIDQFFDCNENEQGAAALIAEVAGSPIYAASDQYGYQYVGIYALSRFPWDKAPEDWQTMTIEKVENAIRPLVEDLYGACPEFGEQIIWMYG